jgi:hypothetical protein
MVDLNMCERCVELHIDVALPGRKPEGGHSGAGDSWGGVLDSAMRDGDAESMLMLARRIQATGMGVTRVVVLVTKQCTWLLSGTVGLVLTVLELEAAELTGAPRLSGGAAARRVPAAADALATRSNHGLRLRKDVGVVL